MAHDRPLDDVCFQTAKTAASASTASAVNIDAFTFMFTAKRPLHFLTIETRRDGRDGYFLPAREDKASRAHKSSD